MNQIVEKWAALTKKIDGLQVRERLILTSAVIVLMWIGAMVILIEPMLEMRKKYGADLSQLKLSVSDSESNFKILSIEYSVDPNIKPRTRLRELTHQLRRIEGDIENKSQHLVPAQKTAQVLQDILVSQTSLYLTSLEKLAPIAVPIMEGNTSKANKMENDIQNIAAAIQNSDLKEVKVLMSVVEKTDPFLKRLENQTNIYKHGVRMNINGQFLDVLSYLLTLEKMDWKVYWRSFEYNTTNYPMGRASFIIETLGFDQGWIGV